VGDGSGEGSRTRAGGLVKALVTGGGGFLGRRVVELLVEEGAEVRSFARGRYPEVEALGVECVQGDLCNPADVERAVAGCDVVFHVAAVPGVWGKRETFWSINVDGTRNVLAAMQKAGVGRLVYTGTPSVVGYETDIENGSNDLPYVDRHLSIYPESKAAAEKLVLAANGPGLATVALRPHLIFGPRDNHLLTEISARAVAGKLPMVGDGTNRVDFTYVDNAAWAHLDAARALATPKAACAGKAYFISNDEPVVLWDFLNELFERIGAPRVERQVPRGLARSAAAALDFLWTYLPLPGEPRLTRFLADALARSHWYDMGPARRDLGYEVRVSMAEGLERTIPWLADELRGS
jgi:nucleoside-diphosphate-sugar epimerase